MSEFGAMVTIRIVRPTFFYVLDSKTARASSRVWYYLALSWQNQHYNFVLSRHGMLCIEVNESW